MKVTKSILDLDDLLRALRASLPPKKPWQRQLLWHLSDCDRRMQILRMLIAMERGSTEIVEAVELLHSALRVTQRYAATGRADLGTKLALAMASEMGQRMATELGFD